MTRMTRKTRKIRRTLLLVAVWCAVAPQATQAQELTAVEAISRSQDAFLAAGDDMHARITMTLVNKAGQTRVRELTMLRKDLDGGNQKYLIYFHRPSDVRGMTFMVWKYPGRDDDRWLFVPAVRLVRRLAADDSRSSFVGSDFTYEDISGRDVEADTHTLLGDETLDGTVCYVVESVPANDKTEYSKKVSWIDKRSLLSLKEEYYDRRGALHRVYTADAVTEIGGHPTVTRRTMTDVKTQHRTDVVYDSVAYDVGLSEDLFTERSLRRPPAEWIR